MPIATLTDDEKRALGIIAQREAQATTTKYEKAEEHFELKVDAPERTKATQRREREQQVAYVPPPSGLPTIYKGETIPLREVPIHTRVFVEQPPKEPFGTIGGYTLTQIGALPSAQRIGRLQAEGWSVVPVAGRTDYFGQYMELNRELMELRRHPDVREDKPLYVQVGDFFFGGGLETATVDLFWGLLGIERTEPTIYEPQTFQALLEKGHIEEIPEGKKPMDVWKYTSPLAVGSSFFGEGALRGIVKEIESTVGFVEALAGAPSRRSYIQTFGGALAGEGVALLTRQPLGESIARYEESLGRDPTGEIMGEMFTMYGTSVLIGSFLGKVGGAVGSYLGGTRVGQAIKETVKFSRTAQTFQSIRITIQQALPAWKGSKADVWLARNWSYYYQKTGGISLGDVVLPHLAGDAPRTFGMLKAQYGASLMMEAPRTSGIGLGKYFLEPSKKGLPHLISRGGALSIGYLRDLSFQKTPVELLAEQRAVLPFVSQSQLTRMGIVPYMGGRKGLSLAKSLSSSLTLGLTPSLLGLAKPTLKPKLKLKEWTPSISRELERSLTRQFEEIEVKQEEIVLPKIYSIPEKPKTTHIERYTILKAPPKLKERELQIPVIVPVLVPKLQQKQLQAPLLKQIQVPKIVPPKLFIPPVTPPYIPPFMKRAGGQDRSGFGKTFFGAWGTRVHPIKTYKQMEASFFGRSPKRKRKKKRRGRPRRLTQLWF